MSDLSQEIRRALARKPPYNIHDSVARLLLERAADEIEQLDLTAEAAELSQQLGVYVEAKEYDVGYWTRYAGRPVPEPSGPRHDGWSDCHRELEDERRAEAGTAEPWRTP